VYTSLKDVTKNLRLDYEPDELLGTVIGFPLEFSHGEQWDYSNTGYFLLGFVIEKASGQPYAEFLDSCIFRPLGMEAARLNDQFELITNRATGYEPCCHVSLKILRMHFRVALVWEAYWARFSS
jgi:D-alanyl-D-alanine carboxypeptidase